MKLKTYTAQTMAEAMEQAKLELGEEALIVSSTRESLGSGVKITVAIEEDDISEKEIEMSLRGSLLDRKAEKIKEVLDYHSIQEVLKERILMHVAKSQTNDAEVALAFALDNIFRFSPLKFSEIDKSYIITGTAGSGKSSVVAKLATEAKLSGFVPTIISTDTYRAGANPQMAAFAKILEVEFLQTKSPKDLKKNLQKARETSDLIFIDTQSVNPFADTDFIRFSDLLDSSKDIEPIFVTEAGGDVEETVEKFCIFAENGINKFIVTKLDISKRLGGIIAGAYHSSMSFYGASISNTIANSLKPLDAGMLKKLLLPVDFMKEKD